MYSETKNTTSKNYAFMFKIKSIVVLMCLGLTLFSCQKDKDENKPSLSIPTTYEGAAFATNTEKEASLKSNLSTLSNEMKKGRVSGTTVGLSTLNNLFTGNNPSLSASSTAFYTAKVSGENGYLANLAAASGGVYVLGEPTGQGGTLGGYLFDENGIEPEQLVEKGLFGAALYNQATTLFSDNLTLADVDKIVALFGANPTFPNTNTNKAAQPDGFMAGYAARRDKNDGNGLYSQFKNNAIKLQAAVKAGNDYKEEQKAALTALKQVWEKANAATVINYCHAVISRLSNTNPSEADVANALHAYSEGVGFIQGWKTIPQAHKIITDAQIDDILGLFNAPSNQIPTSYKFATDPINELPKIQQAMTKLQAIYAFTPQEMEDFKKNWVSEQNR